MKHWMMFRADVPEPQYFLYNGVRVINITPDDAVHHVWGEPGKPLEDCFNVPRKKMFVNDKTRFTIIARGKFDLL